MRLAYVKNGDAVTQVRRVLASGASGGPDANVGGFLSSHDKDEIIVLCRSRPADRLHVGRVEAESLPGLAALGSLFGRASAALKVVRRLLTWKPDRILCGCGREVLWLCVAMARLRRIPIVIARHTGMPVQSGLQRLAYALESACLRLADGVVCHGAFLADSVRAAGVLPDRVVEFDVDLRDFAAGAALCGVPDMFSDFAYKRRLLVMYVGRMQADKGILDLLEAVRCGGDRVARDVGLVYVGDGDDLDTLRDNIAQSGMGDRVIVMGRVPHAMLAAAMKCAAVIVTPTRPPLQEGRCMVVAEAFVLGLPVIAPAYAAFPYSVVDGVNGLLYEPGSIEDLKLCIQRVVADHGLIERLRCGAVQSGRLLLEKRQHDFASAVEAAFG